MVFMAISLSSAERETTMNVDEEEMQWHIYTCQRRVMTRLNNAGWEAHNTYEDEGRIISAEYTIPFNAITIRSEKSVNAPKKTGRKLTPEHLAKMQAARNS